MSNGKTEKTETTVKVKVKDWTKKADRDAEPSGNLQKTRWVVSRSFTDENGDDLLETLATFRHYNDAKASATAIAKSCPADTDMVIIDG